MADGLKKMNGGAEFWERIAAAPIGRRAALYLGAHAAFGLWAALGTGAFIGLIQSLAGCVRAPGTARDQLIFISEEREMAMGVSAFRQVLRGSRLSDNPDVNEMVNRIGQRIADAAKKPEYQWEFAVIEDQRVVNAFALPGGKVAVYTGLLRYSQTEAGLATVMGHEVAHALQRHGAERMSRGILEQIAQVATMAGAASGAVDPGVMQGLQSAYGVGVSLPFNRKQETEADFVGLRLMAQAGYDPREAVPFWERMSGCPKQFIGKLCFRSNAVIPEFLSTHPSDITRIRQIEAWIPDAMRFYRAQDAPLSPPPEPAPPPPLYRPPIGPMPEAG
ncbi:MAG TPA: M48 family metallopeptidase [Nitrospiraceae bacterium]|jgi:predicted Zn-dependent protease|nr:M48 family metallopeptidase [Nitrospiraceae bacterium]